MDALSQTLLTLWGYPLSLLEVLGVFSGLLAVFLAWKELPINFLVGLFNYACYFLLFYQFRLYSVMLLQVVYAVFSIYGYFNWKHPKKGLSDKKNQLQIRMMGKRKWLVFGCIVLVLGVAWGNLVIYVQALYPAYVEPPAYPRIDALLTIASVGAQWLLSRKYWDNWVLWLIIDVSSTVFYGCMGMALTAVMYGLFSLIALKAVIDWKRTLQHYKYQ